MIVANDTTVEAVAALSDIGKYVAVDVQSMNTVAEAATGKDDDDDEDDGSGVRLYQSIYETALRNKVPAAVIEDMVRIYSYDVDFQRKVQPGDSFDVFFAGEDEGATITEKTEVLFASLTVGGETKKYYRFQTPDDSRWSTITTRPARARRSSWCANPSTTRSCVRASAAAAIRSSATPRCTPASTGRRPTARRFSPPATAWSRRSAGKAATANMSA